MAGHTGFSGRDPGKGAYLDSGVAIATVDSHAGNMVFMAEMNRLVNGHIDLIDEVSAVDIEQNT